ncbi:hypothetical protein TELCIR_04046 [Teladorsagia circumcincta]|uniref:MULE transposase domain-containing protein n=1 Tax=Teladorsagia circumcincta TaxID=45464 RepID=A0A2G9UUW7_TELCI|nr:hypothetical protein TELCIR_04046 [Teladorsagia circumcincta]
MDDTFNLTAYCLRLTTVVVADEWDRGLPAAYLLSNRMTENGVAAMYEEVKRLVPNFDTEYFMSDDCNAFYNGFTKVFPRTRTQKLLCFFHVIQAIKRNCNAELKQKQLTEPVLATVRNLCKTVNPNEFASKYSSLMTFPNGQGEKDMAEYLEKTWYYVILLT